MQLLGVVARLLLAVVFLVAAVGKLRNRPGTKQAVRNLGIPRWLSGPITLLLPPVELVVALLLIPATTAAWAAAIAFSLLLLFTLVLAVNLASGRKPACGCFGRASTQAIGWTTVLRNVLLSALAAAIAAGPDTLPIGEAVSSVSRLSGTEVVASGIAVVALLIAGASAWLSLNLLRQQGRMLMRLEAVEPAVGHAVEDQLLFSGGSEAPEIELPDLSGTKQSLDDLLQSEWPLLLVFTDPRCGPCEALMPELGGWQRGTSPVSVTLVSVGSREENQSKAREHGLTQVLLDDRNDVAPKFGVVGTPSGVAVSPSGTIVSRVAEGTEEIRTLHELLVANDWLSSPTHPDEAED